MAKIQRATQKIFAGNSSSDSIAAFGSMKTGTPVYTDNIEDLQTSSYEEGWEDAIVADEAPFLEEMNGVQYGFSKQLAYLFQQGIAEWDAGTTYYTNSFCSQNGLIYRSKQDDNTNHSPADDTTAVYWEEFKPDSGGGSSSGSGFNMFDLVVKDHVLSFEESKGFALLGSYVYKEGSTGTRYGYPDFYNKCIEEYTEAEIPTTTFEQPILTSNGTMGGNSFAVDCSSYFLNSDTYNAWRAVNGVTDVQTDVWACENNSESAYFDFYNPKPIKVKTLTILNRYSGTVGAITAGNIQGSNNGSTWETIKSFTNDVETANTSWKIDLTTNTKFYKYYRINCTAFTGSYCCINQLYIEADESLNSFPAKVSTNGHKFYDIADKAIVDSLFEELGEAWYYGIDTVNQRICLPRATRFQYTTDNVGTYQEAGLPNIEGEWIGKYKDNTTTVGISPQATLSGCYKRGDTVGFNIDGDSLGTNGGNAIAFDASLSNSVYGNSDTVTPSATNMLLYMVVGNTDVESAITDIVDVTTTENDTIPLFTGVYFDFKPNHPSWLKAGTQHESARRSSSHCTVSLNLIRPCASGCGNPRNGAAVSMAGLFLPR